MAIASDVALWPHQTFALEEIPRRIDAGERKICLTAPTGAGKTRIVCGLIEWALGRGTKAIVYTNRKLLIEQLASVIRRHGIEFGVRASGHHDDRHLPVQISSLPTENQRVLKSEQWQVHGADGNVLAIVDEAHINASNTAQQILQRHHDAGGCYVGVTATPIDLGHLYDNLVVAGTQSELRRCGALVPAYHYGPDEPDMKKFKANVKTGEYSEGDVRKAVMTKCIFARVVREYRHVNADGRPTILFAPGVKESIWFAEHFTEAGVRAAHIDGEGVWIDGEYRRTTDREQILADVRNGDIQVLSNRFVCLDEATEILTKEGWVGIDDITAEHSVANWQDGHVYFETPRQIVRRRRQPGERMVVLETPRRSIRVTEGHELLYRTTRDGKFLKSHAASLAGKSVGVPVSGFAIPDDVQIEQPDMTLNFARRVTANAFVLRKQGFEPSKSRAEAARRISERRLLRYKQPSELTEEECEFIGFWIGDGNRNRLQSGGIEYRLSQAASSVKIVRRIDFLCEAIGVDVLKRNITNKFGIVHCHWSIPRGTGFGPQRRRGLFPLEPYLEKDGSELFRGLNNLQFDSLIRGLWMADGCPHNDNTSPSNRILICGVNRKLFDLLQGVAVCRGYRASIRSYRQSNPKCANLLMLTLTKTDEHRMTKHRLRFDEHDKDERVWCVRTSSGNIITRRNGSVTVMGNCREGLDLPEVSHVILATVMGGLRTYLQAVGRGLRACQGKESCTIQDHGGHWHRHGSVNADRQWNLNYTDSIVNGLRQEAFREKKQSEPIRCAQCGMIRAGGTGCPQCGHESTKSSRVVIQLDGTLQEHTGDIYKPRKVQMRHNTADLWKQMYHRARRSRNHMTFNQAYALFFLENGYYYPPKDLAFMPTRMLDWFMPVADVPKDRLIQ